MPLLVVCHLDYGPRVVAFAPVHVVRGLRRMPAAHALWSLAIELVSQKILADYGHCGLAQNDLHALALSGQVPMAQRRHDASGDMEGRVVVGIVIPRLMRTSTFVPRNIGQPAQGVGSGAKRDVVAPRPVIAQSWHGDHDQVGTLSNQRIVCQVEVAHHPGAVVFYHHVANAHKLAKYFLPIRLSQVYSDAALCPVDFVERRDRVVRARLIGRRRVHGYVADGTTPGQLNLDNLRTEMRQHPCRDGAGDHVSQVYDSDVFEREFAFVVL